MSNLSLSLHIVGIVMWIGGLLILTRCLKVFSRKPFENPSPEAREGAQVVSGVLTRLLYGFVLTGFALVVFTGTIQLILGGATVYFAQGWFHAKLTLVLVLAIITFLVAGEVKKISRGINEGVVQVKASKALALHAISGLCLIFIVLLAKRVLL